MQGVKAEITPCHRWALDLVKAGEIASSGSGIVKEIICMLGGQCSYPGCTVTKHYMLTITHRNGDGAGHRKQFATYYSPSISGTNYPAASMAYYGSIIADIKAGRGDRYQLLCENHHRELDWMARREKRSASKRSSLRPGVRNNGRA